MLRKTSTLLLAFLAALALLALASGLSRALSHVLRPKLRQLPLAQAPAPDSLRQAADTLLAHLDAHLAALAPAYGMAPDTAALARMDRVLRADLLHFWALAQRQGHVCRFALPDFAAGPPPTLAEVLNARHALRRELDDCLAARRRE